MATKPMLTPQQIQERYGWSRARIAELAEEYGWSEARSIFSRGQVSYGERRVVDTAEMLRIKEQIAQEDL